MITITAGMIKAFEDCAEKYRLIYEKHLEIPSDDKDSETGKKIHALISYQLKNSDMKKFLTSLQDSKNADLKNLWENYLECNIQTCEEAEYSFNVPLSPDFKITGRVDAIRKTKNGYEILDWKTGKSKNIQAESDWQTIIYLLGIYKLFKYQKKINSPEQLSMTYCFLKEKTSATVNFSELKYREYSEKLEAVCKLMLKPFSTETGTIAKCQKCSFNIVCDKGFDTLKNVL